VDIGKDFSPELLFYREGTNNRFGANITRSVGQRIVAYAEWAGGDGSDLVDAALRYGRQTGTLPPNAPGAIPDDSKVRFQNDLSVGASYTTSRKVTLNVEYHLHQAGFSRQEWSDWFNAGQDQISSSPIARQLWYIRSYALDRQDPLARHSTFLRADWADAFISDLEITALVNTDVYDGSSLVQMGADYYFSNAWTASAQVNVNLGTRRSDFGSLSQSFGMLLRIARYF
jgi:hypothetical protein